MTLGPQNEGARKALSWISERRKDDPQADIAALIDEAGQKFDLKPLEQESLLTWLADIRKGR